MVYYKILTHLDPNQEHAPGAECERLDCWSLRLDSSAENGFWNTDTTIYNKINRVIN